MTYYMQRSFVAPASMPEAAVAYYVDMFKKLSQSEEWQAYASKKALMTDFLSGDALQTYFLEERAAHAEILKNM